MTRNSIKYRNAAAACRETALTAKTPTEWLEFAAEWERMADLVEWLVQWPDFKKAPRWAAYFQIDPVRTRNLH